MTRLPARSNNSGGLIGAASAVVGTVALLLAAHGAKILVDHFSHQRVEAGAVLPAELLPRLRGIADQQFDLGLAEVTRVDFDPHAAGPRLDALLVDAAAAPLELDAEMAERVLGELPHGVALA